MKLCHRICASILAVATTLLAAPFALAKDVAIPQETLRVPGLRAAAEIRVDRWGVPHIYARSEADLFYVQGFNAARDRLFQIDLWRRRGLGQLSEVFGPGFLDQDRAARLFLYRGDMDREWRIYSNWDNSRAVNHPGQSGDPESPHYRDLAPLWSEGKCFPLLYSRNAVERATERVIRLLPESR